MPRIDSGHWLLSSINVLLVIITLGFTACVQNLPELDPLKYASPDPGEEWKPPPDQESAPLAGERLPAIPSDLEPYASKLNLSQLVDVALRDSPATRQAWEQARAAAAEWAAARGSYYPTISGSGTFGQGKGGETGGVDTFEETLGQGSLEDAEVSLQAAELQLRVGVGTIVDVYQAQASLAQVKLDLVADRGSVEISRGQLATVVGWPANTSFDVAEEPEDLPLNTISQNVEELIKLAQQKRPGLAAARAEVRQNEEELRQAESAQWPQFVASAQVSPLVAREKGMNDYTTNYFAGVQLQIPIFQGFSLTNAVRAARAELEASLSALVLQEEIVISEVWTAYYNFRTAAEQLQASDVLLASAKESFDASLTRYQSGVGDIIELLNAQSLLAEARAEQVQARTSLYTSYAELIRAIGEELPVAPADRDSVPSGNEGETKNGEK